METNPNPNATSVQILKEQELLGKSFSVYGTPEQPLFKAQDVAEMINHSDVSTMMRRIDPEEKDTKIVCTLGGNQQSWFLTEDGLYEVLMQSRKPIAKQFKKGVKEILKEIRKSGGYMVSTPDESPEVIMARALRLADLTLKRNAQRVAELEQDLQQVEFKLQATEGEKQILVQQNSKMLPKAEYTEQVLQSTDTYTFTQVAKSLNLRSVYVLEALLKDRKVIYKQSGQWMPCADYAGKGYFSTRTHKYFKSDGTVGTTISTVITERGRAWIHYTFFKTEAQA